MSGLHKVLQGSKYTTVSKYVRVLNMSGFIKKSLHHIDAWQGTDYSSGSAYQDSKYAKVMQGS